MKSKKYQNSKVEFPFLLYDKVFIPVVVEIHIVPLAYTQPKAFWTKSMILKAPILD